MAVRKKTTVRQQAAALFKELDERHLATVVDFMEFLRTRELEAQQDALDAAAAMRRHEEYQRTGGSRAFGDYHAGRIKQMTTSNK